MNQRAAQAVQVARWKPRVRSPQATSARSSRRTKPGGGRLAAAGVPGSKAVDDDYSLQEVKRK